MKLFLVDDHALMLSGLRTELGASFQIVGTATDVSTAIRGINDTEPDVVLLDVHIPGGGGAEVVRACPGVRFLALSVSDAESDVIEVIRAGARGYVTKSIAPVDLVDAIERVHTGDAVFSPRLAGFVLDSFAGPATLDGLTEREREVLRLIARGYAYKQCARELQISVKTVETHVSAVLRKLQLSSRYELSRWAADRGVV